MRANFGCGWARGSNCRHYARRIDVLFLCTGNICRSPMAEALLRHRAEQLSLDLAVSSAGLMYDGAPASDGAIEAMRRRKIDMSGHTSRVVHAGLLAEADLVLCMARMHLREAIVMDRECFGKTFTVKEFVRRAEGAGPRGAEPFPDWLVHVGAGRTPTSLLGDDPADEVARPARPVQPVLPPHRRGAGQADRPDRVVRRCGRAGTGGRE